MKKSLVLLAMCTWGYASAQNSSTTNSSMNGTDANTFVRRAAMINMMEIRAGEMARQKGASSAVRAYGERLVTDHQKSLNELQAIAGRKNITLPTMDRTAMNNSQSWNNAGASSGMNTTGMGTGSMARFDEAKYRSDMIARHGKPEKYRNTAGTATFWTPGFQGTVGLSTRKGNRSAVSNRSNDVYTASEYQSGNTMNAGTSGTLNTSASNTSSWNSSNNSSINSNAGINSSASTSANLNTSTHSNTAGHTGAMGVSGNTSASAGAQAGTNSQIDANRNSNNTSMEPGVASEGTLGVSGTTGTLTANAAFNGATMGTDNTNSTNNTNSNTTGNNSAMGASSSAGVSSGVSGTSSMSANTSISGTAVPDLATEQQQHESHLNMLNQKSGAEFDRAFADMMRSGHSKAIQLYEQAAQSSDSEISAYASRTLPVLRAHQTEAQNLNITQ